MPVGGRPFLEWQLEWLARGGIRRIHLAAGHLGAMLADWIRQWRPAGAAAPLAGGLTCSIEPAALGTGGGLRYAAEFVADDPVLVVNGDSLLPSLDFQALETALAETSKAWMAMAVTRIDDAARYGTVEIASGRVVAFLEKGRAASGWVNGGVYLMRREAIESIQRSAPSSLETDLFPAWAHGERIAVVAASPPLFDMGTPEGLATLDEALRRPLF